MPSGDRIDGAVVDQDRLGVVHAGQNALRAEEDRLHIGRGRDVDADNLRPGRGNLRRRGQYGRAASLQIIRFGPRTVGDGQPMPRVQQASGHRIAHDPETHVTDVLQSH